MAGCTRMLHERTGDWLRGSGIDDTGRALRFLAEMAGQGVSDDDLEPLWSLLGQSLRSCPDPDLALQSFVRWFTAVGNRYSHLQMLLRHPVALDLFGLVTSCSKVFADLLAQQPECFEILANPGVRGGTKTAAAFYRSVSNLVDVCRMPELKGDALRRWKAREMLRIGVRDLVGLADMPLTAREFSNLADACVQKALDIALICHPSAPGTWERLRFAVIAMGKLGGQELNYSSDIDLMFVHGDDLPAEIQTESGKQLEATVYLTRLAETLVRTLSGETANGHVFRVDMRLRPEGRFGALTRSLSGYRHYYENWAESWERQALLKARFIAGDRELGENFMRIVEPYVYRRSVSAQFLEDIQANKRRTEQKCAVEEQTETNIKTGYGGIRDVEFLVQRLQLQHGGGHPRLRTPNTLAAIQRLRQAGYLSSAQARDLADDYQFLRTLEHRLQLLQGFQTQTLPPKDSAERARLARRMGFAGAPEFEDALRRRRERVHAALQTLFYCAPEQISSSQNEYADWSDLEALLNNLEAPTAQERLAERLRTAGFRDIPAALRALQLPMRGNDFGGMPPDTPVEFLAIAPRLLTLLRDSADPDAGLAGMEALALAVPNRAQLYASFDDSPAVMQRLSLLAAAAPPLVGRLARHLEWLEALLDEDGVERAVDSAEPALYTSRYCEDLLPRIRATRTAEAGLDMIARFHQREQLLIGAHDAWDEADVRETMARLTALAEAILEALLVHSAAPLVQGASDPDFVRQTLARVSAIGLGKLGGAETGYGSDWDVLFVYDAPRVGRDTRGAERFALVSQLIERVLASSKALVPRGSAIEIDLRLRPWGRKGALLHTVQGLIDYYRTAGETWERQAALKARVVAGSRAVGERCVRILHGVSYGRGVTQQEESAVRAMKRRIESERLKPLERWTDIKLGYGGMTDIEWLSQRLQLVHGPDQPGLRHPNTLRALSSLASARLLDNAEADFLMATYCQLTRLRNALWLRTGTMQDILPADEERLAPLARMLGYAETSAEPAARSLVNDVQTALRESRRIFQQRFYEAAPVPVRNRRRKEQEHVEP